MPCTRLFGLLLLGLCSSCALALQIGPDDFRITQAGPALDEDYRAVNADVVYNAMDNEFLVVWSGDADPELPALEDEIYAQRLDGDTGQNIGSPIRVSRMGPDVPGAQANKGDGGGLPFYEAHDPQVAWNSQTNEYLVVWWGDDDTLPLVDDEREVFGRRLAASGAPLAAQLRISFMGTDGDTLAEAISPAVAYSAAENTYLVTWGGDNINGVFINQEFEIWGQRVDGASNGLVGDVIRVSDMGETDGNNSFTAADSNIAVTSSGATFLVTWEGDDDGGTAVNGEDEVYGQLIDASTGLETGPNDLRISDLGPTGDTGYDSTNAAPVFNPVTGEFLVAWNGSDDQDGSIRNDIEIHVQRVSTAGTLNGVTSRISAMGPDGVTTYWALSPVARVNPITGEYLVLWRGEDDEGELVNNEYEIYGQPLTATGQVVRPRRRLSQMGPDGSSIWTAGLPALTYNSATDRFLAVWAGNDERPDLATREFEVFGQFLLLDIVSSSGFE